MRRFVISALLCLTVTAAIAAGPTPETRAPLDQDPGYIAARRNIELEYYAAAAKLLAGVALRFPSNADVFSLHGFASRKSGDIKTARQSYQRALSLDPEHLGALEYQGELFVMTGERERARQNLARLDALCFRCEEYEDLKEAIDASM